MWNESKLKPKIIKSKIAKHELMRKEYNQILKELSYNFRIRGLPLSDCYQLYLESKYWNAKYNQLYRVMKYDTIYKMSIFVDIFWGRDFFLGLKSNWISVSHGHILIFISPILSYHWMNSLNLIILISTTKLPGNLLLTCETLKLYMFSCHIT